MSAAVAAAPTDTTVARTALLELDQATEPDRATSPDATLASVLAGEWDDVPATRLIAIAILQLHETVKALHDTMHAVLRSNDGIHQYLTRRH